jgi:class 3 adenylate cyclase
MYRTLCLVLPRLVAVLLAILDPAMTWAQSAVILHDQSSATFELEKGNMIVLGAAQTMTLDQALKEFDQPHASPSSQPCDPEGCWVGMSLKSGFDRDQEITLTVYADLVDTWIEREDGTVRQLRSTGTMAPRPAHDATGDFSLGKGERVKLVARTQRAKVFPWDADPAMRVQSAAKALEDGRRDDVMNGLLVGGLMTLALYNFLVALTSRSSSYYWYVAYLLFMAFSSFAYDTQAEFTALIFTGHPLLRVTCQYGSQCLMWLCLVAFARSFLDTRTRLPRFDWLWAIPVIIGALAVAAGAFGLDYWNAASYLGYSLPAPLGIVASILCLARGYRPARYFLVAQSVLCIGELIQVAHDFGFIDFDYARGSWGRAISFRTVFLGSLLEAILFSLALSDRVKTLMQTVADQTISNLRDREILVNSQKEQLEIDVAARTRELNDEKQKSDQLLLTVLPAEIAAELKATGYSRPRRYDDASILFTDFRNFTSTVSALPAARLVDELNEIFQEFDEILLAHGVEKIKTIGDSYMVAAGLPEPAPDHAERCVGAALRMLSFIDERNKTSSIKWGMRAGNHSGAVVAGIVGKTKFAFDVFGDTVNIASRMESSGEPGRLNVSAYTFDLIKATHRATYRGKIEMKGKGEIDMYFVDVAT